MRRCLHAKHIADRIKVRHAGARLTAHVLGANAANRLHRALLPVPLSPCSVCRVGLLCVCCSEATRMTCRPTVVSAHLASPCLRPSRPCSWPSTCPPTPERLPRTDPGVTIQRPPRRRPTRPKPSRPRPRLTSPRSTRRRPTCPSANWTDPPESAVPRPRASAVPRPRASADPRPRASTVPRPREAR